MAAPAYPLLAALMTPCSPDQFLSQYWPRRPFVTHGDPQRLPAPLRHEALASAAALAQRYRGNVRFTRGGTSQQMIRSDRVSPVLLQEMGLTLQFDDVVPYVPGADEFLRQLESELGVHQKSLYLSAFASPRDDGLQCHYDAQDLISIQLQGTKRFQYAPMREIRNPYGAQYVPQTRPFDDLYPQAANGFPDFRDVSFETALMKPGSVLFLPRGIWHRTEAGEPSLSLSISINPPPAMECLLEQLRLLLLQDGDWRQPLYGACGEGGQHDNACAQSARLLAQLPALVARLSPEDLMYALTPADKRLQRVTAGSRFQRVPDALLEFGDVSPRSGLHDVTVRIRDTASQNHVAARLEVPPEAVPVFRWMDQRTSPFSAGALQSAFPALHFSKIKDILIVGTDVQFLKLLWFAPLAVPT